MDTNTVSPRIVELQERLQSGDKIALSHFFNQVKKEGTPLIEKDPYNDENQIITYIWKGDDDTKNAYIFGSFPGWDIPSCKLERLLDTNLWFKTYLTKEKLVSTYQFSINDHFEQDWVERSRNYQPDPYNRKVFVHVGDTKNPKHKDTLASVLELKMQIKNDKILPKKNTPQGKVTVRCFYSSLLQNERRIWIYTPHGYSSQQAPYDLLITFDGRPTMTTLSAPTILDNLIYEKNIRPCIMIGIDSVERLNELTFNDDFNSFLLTEFIPWIRETYHVTEDPSHITISGFSLGGLAAFYSALHNPDMFGNVLSLSGSVHWKKEGYDGNIPWIENYFKNIRSLPINIYMSAGKNENKPLLHANQHLYKTLKQLEYQVHYHEFYGGHDEIWWCEQLAVGLMHLNSLKRFNIN